MLISPDYFPIPYPKHSKRRTGMNSSLKYLSIIFPLVMLLGCEPDGVTESDKSRQTAALSERVDGDSLEKGNDAAPADKQISRASPQDSRTETPPLSGEALYSSDKAPDSLLYDKPRQVLDGVWTAIGATSPPRYENSGHNNNLSFVVTSEGVLLVNAGGAYLLAKAMHEEIKKITSQPVKYVILENGQGHAMLGSSYWKQQGAQIIAHEDAAHEIEANAFAILEQAKRILKDRAEGTEVIMPDKTFSDKMRITLGGVDIDLLNLGPAHSPGDIAVWLPQTRLVISGDLAFHQRMLPLFEHTNTAAWIETWDKFEALGAEIVIPGHGEPTNMAEVTRYTRDYLVHLRKNIAQVIDAGGTLKDAYEIDQSPYMHLPTAEFLARRNAGQVFQAMEFE